MFRVTRYPMISKTESGRVGYRKKYQVAGRVRVPAGHWLAHTGHISGLQLSGTSISSVALGQCLHTVQAIQCYACIQLHGSDLEAIQYQGVNLRRPYLPRSQNQSISSDLCWGPGGLFISWKYLHWVKPSLLCVWQLNFILREGET